MTVQILIKNIFQNNDHSYILPAVSPLTQWDDKTAVLFQKLPEGSSTDILPGHNHHNDGGDDHGGDYYHGGDDDDGDDDDGGDGVVK